jgi:PBSX family phage portal protein
MSDETSGEEREAQIIAKATFLGGGDIGAQVAATIATSNARSATEDDQRVFADHNAITPPYLPRQLWGFFEQSSSLRPNVDVYATNIEGFGHRFVPTIDTDDTAKIDDHLEEALAQTSISDGGDGEVDPTDVARLKEELPKLIRKERLQLQAFFDNCVAESSFVELRTRSRIDLEVTGNAYWEVLRDKATGQIAQFVLLPSPSMRLTRTDVQHTEVKERRKVSAIEFRTRLVKRRFRGFVQVLFGTFVAYFKELGDPRTMSARTGKVYASVEEMNKAEENAVEATEVIHFKVWSATTAYGVPRWIGALLAVMGSRGSEEVNYIYFDHKAIPPMAVLVSGGHLAANSVTRLETYIKDQFQGRQNFHKILILEAEPATGGGTVSGANGSRIRVELKPLLDAQHSDALFQTYEANNAEKVGNQFRIPKILRGDMKDFNRSTADAALAYAEQQVFAPERTKIDFMINRLIISELGARLHTFESNAVATKDPPSLAEMVASALEKGGITPNEAREIYRDVFNKHFDPIAEEWGNQPLSITLAKLSSGAAGGMPPDTSKDLGAQARHLIELRAMLAATERKADEAALTVAREKASEEVVTITLTPEQIREFVVPHGQPQSAGSNTESA